MKSLAIISTVYSSDWVNEKDFIGKIEHIKNSLKDRIDSGEIIIIYSYETGPETSHRSNASIKYVNCAVDFIKYSFQDHKDLVKSFKEYEETYRFYYSNPIEFMGERVTVEEFITLTGLLG